MTSNTYTTPPTQRHFKDNINLTLYRQFDDARWMHAYRCVKFSFIFADISEQKGAWRAADHVFCGKYKSHWRVGLPAEVLASMKQQLNFSIGVHIELLIDHSHTLPAAFFVPAEPG